MFDALFDGLAGLLAFFYELAPDYGIAIALLTAAVMLLCFPLTAKSTRSMAAMTKLQPELKQIQQKYKDDRQKQSEATMALFKEHKVTPFGGCLPMLVQAPIFIVMYNVIAGLTRKGPDGGFDPKYLSEDSALYRALEGAKTMMSFGLDLAKNASDAAKDSFVSALPFFVLIAAVVATGYYQQRQITRRNPQQANSDNPQLQAMQRMTKIYPLMYLVFGFTLPAGVVVYFLVSNLFRIGQQALIYRLDPQLAPGRGATIEADAVEKKLEKKKGEPSAEGKGSANGAPQRSNGRPKGRQRPKKSRRGR